VHPLKSCSPMARPRSAMRLPTTPRALTPSRTTSPTRRRGPHRSSGRPASVAITSRGTRSAHDQQACVRGSALNHRGGTALRRGGEKRHLAFGRGRYCLGAELSRTEAAIGIRTVLRRFPSIQLYSEGVEWRRHFNHRGWKSLPAAL
jgi:hypothetical protein